MRAGLIIALLLLGAFNASAQYKRIKKKVSYDKGTLFVHWGYNRTKYTSSNIRFVGPGYDFTMQGAKAHDNPEKFSSVYFNPNSVSVPQFNWRIGYYFKKNWAISFGQDHMKYLFQHKNEVLLSGYINEGVDQVTNWEGTYEGAPIVTDRGTFHYESSDGLNYMRFELTRTDQWLRLGELDRFAISTNMGLSVGGLLSYTDFRFAKTDINGNVVDDIRTISLSGYGISAHAGVRLEFFRNFYLMPNLSGGLMNHLKNRTRNNDPTSYAKHVFGFGEFNVVGGFLFYIQAKNKCDSCPKW